MTAETYPTDNSGNTANLSYAFDKMGRLNTMTDNVAMETVIAGASYGPANELTGITAGGAWGSEIRPYNSLKQLTGISAGTLSIAYAYPTTGNNGKISSQTDVSGETVTYTYDTLNRLIKAANQTTFTPEWGQSFGYDGFGNLTSTTVTQGSAPTLSAIYDAKNHAGGEDANGNPSYVPLPAYGTSVFATYDVENRLVSGPAYYSYAPGNKRVWRGTWTTTYSDGSYIYTRGTDEITFWSVSGQKLGDYALTTISGLPSEPQFYATETECNYYFGSKLIKNINGWVYSDRLASIGKFYPYGIQRPSATANGTEKFTGYFRDSESGNDYADQRCTSPGMGRFITPDPMGGGHPADPSSWNKYAYTRGDPIGRKDPGGNYDCTVGVGDYAETTDCEDVTVYAGPANPQCMLYLQAASGSPANPVAQEQYETYCAQVGGPSPQNPPPAPAPPPTCEQQEIEYVYQYLNSYGSPLATMAIATQIVDASDAAGVDDRFIVALAGIESQYGKTALISPTWGQFNAFSNSQHCKALSATSSCASVNPYTSYAQAVNGVISLVTTGAYQSLSSGASVYNLYEKGNPTTNAPALPGLTTIYGSMGGNMQDVKFSRCP